MLAASIACGGLVLSSACSVQEEAASSTQDSLQEAPAPAALFAPALKRVVIEVDYAAGAEPFALSTTAFRDPWAIFRDNARAILGGRVDLVVPDQLSEMERLDDVTATTFTSKDLIALAQKHRQTISSGDTTSFYVIFLAGKFKDDDGRVLDNRVGVSVRGTGIIAMFKPAITVGFTDPVMPVFMEQTTLVHEFGHAVGLVGESLPATSEHRDDPHGAHCRNPDCIMFWRNDMVKEGVPFVSTYLAPRNGILFGSECLADARALESKLRVGLTSIGGQSSVPSTDQAAPILDE